MSRHAIGLSDRQLDIILEASTRVPSAFRTRFLENVADHLFACDPIEDEHVGAAVRHVGARMCFVVDVV